jgi:hypothetical protein
MWYEDNFVVHRCANVRWVDQNRFYYCLIFINSSSTFPLFFLMKLCVRYVILLQVLLFLVKVIHLSISSGSFTSFVHMVTLLLNLDSLWQ